MSLKERIDNAIQKGYSEPNRKHLIINKYQSEEYLLWIKNMKDVSICGLIPKDDTTSQNMGLTSLLITNSKEYKITNSKEYNIVSVDEWFYIQKSMLGNFVALYGIIRTRFHYGEDQFFAPRVVVYSPIGPFKELYSAAWEVVKSKYPGCEHLSGQILSMEIDHINREHNSIYSLLFGYNMFLPPNSAGDSNFRYR